MALGQAVRASGKALDVYGVEHGRGSEEHRDEVAAAGSTVLGQLASNLLECGVSNVGSLIVAHSSRAARLFAPRSVDFALIDASHDYQSVLPDLAGHGKLALPGRARKPVRCPLYQWSVLDARCFRHQSRYLPKTSATVMAFPGGNDHPREL